MDYIKLPPDQLLTALLNALTARLMEITRNQYPHLTAAVEIERTPDNRLRTQMQVQGSVLVSSPPNGAAG